MSLTFNFTGTIFYRGEDGRMQIVKVPWECSTGFAMPVATWRGWSITATRAPAGWRCGDETMEALRASKAERGLHTFDATVADLLREPRRVSTAQLDELVETLLYEGYALYPYTRGATKNATPTPFGVVYPPAYAQAPPGHLRPSQARMRARSRGGGARRRGQCASCRRAARRHKAGAAPGRAA